MSADERALIRRLARPGNADDYAAACADAEAVLAAYDAIAGETGEPGTGDVLPEGGVVYRPDATGFMQVDFVEPGGVIPPLRTDAVAAGGATPDPAERVWRCNGDGDLKCGPGARRRPGHSGCGPVPSEEGTTPR